MTTYIYESPNGGKTVKQREFGSAVTWDANGPVAASCQQMRENQLWYEIRRAAKTNPVLQEILEQAIIIYQLSKSE